MSHQHYGDEEDPPRRGQGRGRGDHEEYEEGRPGRGQGRGRGDREEYEYEYGTREDTEYGHGDDREWRDDRRWREEYYRDRRRDDDDDDEHGWPDDYTDSAHYRFATFTFLCHVTNVFGSHISSNQAGRVGGVECVTSLSIAISCILCLQGTRAPAPVRPTA